MEDGRRNWTGARMLGGERMCGVWRACLKIDMWRFRTDTFRITVKRRRFEGLQSVHTSVEREKNMKDGEPGIDKSTTYN